MKQRAALIAAGVMVLAGGLALWMAFGDSVVLATFVAMCF